MEVIAPTKKKWAECRELEFSSTFSHLQDPDFLASLRAAAGLPSGALLCRPGTTSPGPVEASRPEGFIGCRVFRTQV